jgi:hypothetical protein
MKKVGRPRRVTAQQLRVIRAWKPLREVAKSVGLTYEVASWARNYHFKQPSP